MRAADYAELAVFVAVAEERSFRRGAARLGVTSSRASHALRSLEARLGTKLLNRTTRSVAITEAGRALLAALAPSMTTIAAALEAASHHDGRPRGVLRLNVPRLAISMIFAPVLARYATAYPEVVLEVTVSEGLEDVVGDGFDAAVRLGEHLDEDMIAVPLTAPFKTAVVGSPSYFESNAPPDHPRALVAHRCIQCRSGPDRTLYRWEFERDGDAIVVDVTGPVITDSVELMMQAALDGVGLFHGVDQIVKEHVNVGTLIQVLGDWSPTYPGFYLYYPGRRNTPPALLALVDMIRWRQPQP